MYRNYKSFSNENYKSDLVSELFKESFDNANNSDTVNSFLQLCVNVLDKQAPQKKKHVRGNQSLFMNRELLMNGYI